MAEEKVRRGAEGRAARRQRAKKTAQLHEMLEGMKERAQIGDRDTLQKLANVLKNQEVLAELDEETRNYFVRQSVDGLQYAKKFLGVGEYEALAVALAFPHVADTAIEILGRAAKDGRTSALKVLRMAAQAPAPIGDAAAEALATARKALVDKDFDLIARHGLRAQGASAAKALIAEQVREGKAAAIEAISGVLGQKDDEDPAGLGRAQSFAAKLFIENTDLIGPKDVKNLARYACLSEMAVRAQVLEAIAIRATSSHPVRGSADAFDQVMRSLPVKVALDTTDAVRAIARKYALDAFRAARQDPDAQEKLAPYALQQARDEESALEVMEILHDMALDDEEVAMAALAEAAGRLSTYFPKKAGQKAVEILEQTAREGMATKVVSVLLAESERKGQTDDERCFEALGRAAQFLDRSDPLMRQVRLALRMALKRYHPLRTKGHTSALRGMQAIAPRLLTDDMQSLLDNLSALAGQVLGQAAHNISGSDRDVLRDTLRTRLRRKINVDGALAALSGMEQYLEEADLEAMAHKTRISSKTKMSRLTSGASDDSLADILSRTATGDAARKKKKKKKTKKPS